MSGKRRWNNVIHSRVHTGAGAAALGGSGAVRAPAEPVRADPVALRAPELLLDEPSNGLDPRGIGEMRALPRQFAAQGTTVVLSSHLLGEVEAVCTRVGVLSAGRLVLDEDLDALRAPTGLVRLRTLDPAAAVGAHGSCTATAIWSWCARTTRPRSTPGWSRPGWRCTS